MSVITHETTIKVALGIGVGIIISVWSSGWMLRGKVDDFERAVDRRFVSLETRLDTLSRENNEHWSNTQMLRWASGLDRENRDVLRAGDKRGLVVPEVTPPK